MPSSPDTRSIPLQRIQEKVDECMSRRDYAGVERILLYWREEAWASGDRHGQLMILSELVGHYRKVGNREKIHRFAESALRLIRELGCEQMVYGATVLINIATAYNSQGENAEALPLFEQARSVYEKYPDTDKALIGGLYNNLGLTYTALGRYDEALDVYHLAMTAMDSVPGGKAEQAITCLNMANTLEAQKGLETAEQEIFALLDRAESLLSSPDIPRNGYFAYVLEHCAPTFDYYGYFVAAQAMKTEAEAIYDRS